MIFNDLKNIFAKHKLDGIIVDVKNLFPVPFKRDYVELRRLTKTKENVYPLDVRMKGNIVLQNPVPHASSQVGSNQNAFLNFFRKIVPADRQILLLADLHNVRNTDNQNIARIKSVVKSSYVPKVTFPQVLPRHQYHNYNPIRIVRNHQYLEFLVASGTILTITGSGLDQVEYNGLLSKQFDRYATLLYLMRDPTLRFCLDLDEILRRIYPKEGNGVTSARDGPLRDFEWK